MVNVQLPDSGVDWLAWFTLAATIAIAALTWVIQRRAQQDLKHWRKEDLARQADRDKPKLLVELHRMDVPPGVFIRGWQPQLNLTIRNEGKVPVFVQQLFIVADFDFRKRENIQDLPHAFAPGDSKVLEADNTTLTHAMRFFDQTETVVHVEIVDGLGIVYISNQVSYAIDSGEE